MTRYQDPAIETAHNAPRPYYFIRPYRADFSTGSYVRKRRLIRLGYIDETSMTEAKRRKQEIMAQINQGKLLLSAQIPFGELVEKYRTSRLAGLASTTRAKYETHLHNHILPAFGACELGEIDRQAIEEWLQREAEPHEHAQPAAKSYPGLGHHALLDLRNIVSAIFTAAIDWRLWQGENPCARIRIGRKAEARERRIPSAAEFQAFLAAIHDTCILDAERARLAVLTAAVAGLRVSEVLGLMPEDVDAAAGTLRVARRWARGDLAVPKSAASARTRQVGPLAVELARAGDEREFIFEREPGLPPDDRDLQQHVFRPAAEAAGIYFAGFGMHSLRRFALSIRQEVGATPFEAMRVAGHTRPAMTYLYTVTDQARERRHTESVLKRIAPKKATARKRSAVA